MTTTEITPELSTRIDALIDDETERFRERQPRSREMSERARTLAGGATSSWQIAEPHAVWISHGAGSKLYDVDGNEYSDFHGGYGVSLAGHAHPAIVEAVRTRVGPRHPLRAADRGRHRGRRQPRRAVRPAAVALRQLRHRGDHGRRPPDARGHRARPDPQGRGLLPRPPRLGAGLGAPRGRRRHRPGRRARSASPTTPGSPSAITRPRRRRAVQRPGRGRGGARASTPARSRA